MFGDTTPSEPLGNGTEIKGYNTVQFMLAILTYTYAIICCIHFANVNVCYEIFLMLPFVAFGEVVGLICIPADLSGCFQVIDK